MKKTMKLVLVEVRLDRVALIAPELQHQIEHVIIYQTSADFEKQIRQYSNCSFKEKIRRVDIFNIFSVLDELYAMKDRQGSFEYAFLFNLCLENYCVPISEKISTMFIQSKSTDGNSRCFVYNTVDRMQSEFEDAFLDQVILTDFTQKNFLRYKENKKFCEALGIIA